MCTTPRHTGSFSFNPRLHTMCLITWDSSSRKFLKSRGQGFNPKLGSERSAAKSMRHAGRKLVDDRQLYSLVSSYSILWDKYLTELLSTLSCSKNVRSMTQKSPYMRTWIGSSDYLFFYFSQIMHRLYFYVLWKNNFRKQLRLRIFKFAVIFQLAQW